MGLFVGMNLYDGSDVTPFLPRHEIVNALKGADNSRLPPERYFFSCYASVITG
jgi:hypothetical protein